MKRSASFGVGLFVFIAGCASGKEDPATVEATELPVIASFTATPPTVAAGGPALLSWEVGGATSLSLDHDIGQLAGVSLSVAPVAPATTFVLTATNAAGSVTATVTVRVSGAPCVPGAACKAQVHGVAFTTGSYPTAVLFAGANVWVANQGSDSVTKLAAADGTNLGTFATGGTGPDNMVFDGTDLWVSNPPSNTISRLRASDGAILGIFDAPGEPHNLAFDGESVWVASADGTVRKFRVSDGSNQGTFQPGYGAWGIAFDGTAVWVSTTRYDASIDDYRSVVAKLLASDGSSLGDVVLSNAFGLTGPLLFDGEHIWAGAGSSLAKIKAADEEVLTTVQLSDGSYLYAGFDGKHVLLPNGVELIRIRASDATAVEPYAVGGFPIGVAFDGNNTWVSSYYSSTVTKL